MKKRHNPAEDSEEFILAAKQRRAKRLRIIEKHGYHIHEIFNGKYSVWNIVDSKTILCGTPQCIYISPELSVKLIIR